MNVLVLYATRHGATRGIAERIGAGLERSGLHARVQSVAEAEGLEAYDAWVIGSATYYFHWLKDATAFVERYRDVLASRPVWLFSSGPVGPDRLDAKGREVLETARPQGIDELATSIAARGHRVFFGAFDAQSKSTDLLESMSRRVPAIRKALVPGDFRDWLEIDAWTAAIARELRGAEALATPA